MDHHFEAGATGSFPDLDDFYYVGNRPNGIYVPRFRNVSRATRRSDYLRGFGYQGEAYRPGWDRPMPGIGAEFKHSLRRPGLLGHTFLADMARRFRRMRTMYRWIRKCGMHGTSRYFASVAGGAKTRW